MFNKCNKCGSCNCTCGSLIAPNIVNNLSTSITNSVPGPQGEQGDSFVPEESDDIFTI